VERFSRGLNGRYQAQGHRCFQGRKLHFVATASALVTPPCKHFESAPRVEADSSCEINVTYVRCLSSSSSSSSSGEMLCAPCSCSQSGGWLLLRYTNKRSLLSHDTSTLVQCNAMWRDYVAPPDTLNYCGTKLALWCVRTPGSNPK
jgi:hypothetical protein